MIEIEWEPKRSSKSPLHQQIYEYMKRKIINGEWTIGTKIPPQRTLAQKFKVNRSTIVTALDELTADGFIDAKVGRGTVVVNNTWSVIAASPPPNWRNYVKAGIHQPNQSIIQAINKAEIRTDIIRLGTGELSPELLPTKKMKSVFLQNTEQPLSLSYTEPKGNLYLRKMICDYLKTKGIEITPPSVLIVSGGLQALQLISLGLLHRDSTIFHETPSYLTSVNVFQSAGMSLFGVPMDNEGIKTDILGRLKRQHNAALLYTIPTFHNPTGILMSENRRKQLLDICSKVRLPIIEDDVYGDLWFDQPAPKPLKAQDKQGLVLYMGSISKTLSPGLRIGWIVGPEPVIDRLSDIKMQTDYGSSSLSQYAVAQWLSNDLYKEHINYVRQELKIRRNLTIQILVKYFSEVATWNVPEGGFYIWLKLNVEVSMDRLYKKALQEGILINPGNIYIQNDSAHIRISYSYATLGQLEKGLMKLSYLIKENKLYGDETGSFFKLFSFSQ
jgi:GntR family transcriptional regulator of abcA and norABC